MRRLMAFFFFGLGRIFGRSKQASSADRQSHVESRYRTSADYYRDQILLPLEELEIRHPTNRDWFNNQIITLCRKRLSTSNVEFLEVCYERCEAAYGHKLLARRIHLLRVEYLQSFKEFSARRLIMLAERENFKDRWEGIYLLGTFGGSQAHEYLKRKMANERDPFIESAMKQAKARIVRLQAEKRRLT